MSATSAEASRPSRRPDPLSSRSFLLWFGVLGPPAAWGAHLVLGDLIFELGCSRGVRGHELLGLDLEVWGVIQTLVLGLVVLAAGLGAGVAWRQLRGVGDGTRWSRAHALALAGMASGAIYLALIAYALLPPVFLERCVTSL